MAWKARLVDPIVSSGDKVTCTFEYYDDANPGEVLYSEAFAFSPSWSTADMSGAVQARGQAARAALVRASQLAAQFPPATTVISIP